MFSSALEQQRGQLDYEDKNDKETVRCESVEVAQKMAFLRKPQ